MKALCVSLVLLVFSCAPGCGLAQAQQSPRQSYNGFWWAGASADERGGFLDGVADCTGWVPRAEWVKRTPDNLDDEMEKYYEGQPKDRPLRVVDVWRRLLLRAAPPPEQGGEAWTNPHGYFNGLYYRQPPHDQKIGFLEGYL